MPNRFVYFCLAVVWCLPASAADVPSTTVEVVTSVPPEQDSCLDHSVRELGMSAKKVDAERRWNIGPQFLHPAIAKDGTFGVRMEKGATSSLIRVTAVWAGDRKAKEVQADIEDRMRSMVAKMAQMCGVTQADLKCQVTDPKGAKAGCPTP